MSDEEKLNSSFATTRWSVVLAAGGDWTQAQRALEQLCQTYWYPLYVYVRRKGRSAQDAEDLTQGFFAQLMEREALAKAQRERGKFRAFLLVSMNHFLADEYKRAHALKRGGHVVALDTTAESRFQSDAQKPETPESAYERQWALQILAEVLKRLEQEYAQSGKAKLFEHLRCCLTGEHAAAPYVELAKQTGMTEGAIKIAAHRMRQRYRKLLREHIAETVASPEDVDDELRFLISALSR